MVKHPVNNYRKIDKALANILGDELSDWEREDLAERLAELSDDILREVMRYLPVIWPVSYALFYAFAGQAAKAAACLRPTQFNSWVHAILDVYESNGLHQAQLFMEDVEAKYVCEIKGEAGVRLEDREALLLTLARGILGRDVSIAQAPEAGFDTETMFLPPEINLFRQERDNFLLYKLTLTFLIGLETMGTLLYDSRPDVHVQGDTNSFLSKFPDRRLAVDFFYLSEAQRIMTGLRLNFSGLFKDCRPLLHELSDNLARNREAQGERGEVVLLVQRRLLSSMLAHRMTAPDKNLPTDLQTALADHGKTERTIKNSFELTRMLYEYCSTLPGPYQPPAPLPFMGQLALEAANKCIAKRRAELRDKFINTLSTVIPAADNSDKSGSTEDERQTDTGHRPLQEAISAMLIAAASESESEKDSGQIEQLITLGGSDLELSEKLIDLTRDVKREFGMIPPEYVSSAIGRAGSGLATTAVTASDETDDTTPAAGPLVYDEWDFRRSGFRKNWCNIINKDIEPIKGTFVSSTMEKYKGLLTNLRRQFELMSIQERFMKRQREGDDIDLDALLESVSDAKAGLAPSERLFIRLQRNERDIAALFLVDMSSSTEGWISTALKESLILMCESLATLGDRYAIYGFSGMRRLRNEFFRVKDFGERYDEVIKGKIAAISPKEYTRMGPAIRHATSIMAGAEARIRLLITLSDGKPEDYDGYKGIYAIEDTRHALIEAKAAGIHPFCITVDKAAHDYMDHMYGEVNYIFIDDVAQLPRRMPEIYRTLTV